jgi:hypothetical protein
VTPQQILAAVADAPLWYSALEYPAAQEAAFFMAKIITVCAARA